uniref:Zwei Ig domain protein zig-8-like n=1 Tax=Dermatophagoides pteronyssinus TaxID=6956 RepID=A0A6P6Y3D3_DERPT|nr:zwei Ig domain protein zig-8-like [Dermatophagoides pteronyssinus]
MTIRRMNTIGIDDPEFKYQNITAQVGHPAYMPCIIDSLDDKMVSWIRLRDFHLLTIGQLTYIQDDRFVVRYGGYQSNDWILQIKHVTIKDEGLYECQINSDPPKSQYFYLHIVVPVTEIIGNPNIFVRLGESINLTCLITQSPEPPAFVFWYHNERMINYDYTETDDGRIIIQKSTEQNDVIISRLIINKAKLEASGNYTCSPSNAEPASTYVHVLQGEKRLSNDVQNDWNQALDIKNIQHKSATNSEGHHSGSISTIYNYVAKTR